MGLAKAKHNFSNEHKHIEEKPLSVERSSLRAKTSSTLYDTDDELII